MDQESFSDLLSTHKQILVQLTKITEDHESRLRILERVAYCGITILAIVQVVFGKFK